VSAALDQALARIDDFMAAHAEDDDAAFDAEIAADPALQDAALEVLGALYLPGGRGADLDARSWTGMAGLVLYASPDARARLVAELLFDVAAPPLYAGLASVLRAAFPPPELARALLVGLASDAPRRRANARALPYYLMGRAGDVVLAEDARGAIIAAGRADDPAFDLPLPALA